MRKIRSKNVLRKKSMIFIIMISSFSLIGVGYAAWTNGLDFESDITTGKLLTTFKVNERNLSLEECERMSLEVIDDSILKIEADVYPTFEDDIPIVVENQGTIPTKLSKLEIQDDGKISKLSDILTTKNRFTTMRKYKGTNSNIDMNTIIDPNDNAESFTINVSARDIERDNTDKIGGNSNKSKDVNSLDGGEEIDRIRNKIDRLNEEIDELEEEIREYEKEKEYDFSYMLFVEQGL